MIYGTGRPGPDADLHQHGPELLADVPLPKRVARRPCSSRSSTCSIRTSRRGSFTTPWRDALVLPNDGGTLNAGPFFDGFDAAAVQAARNAAAPNTGRVDPRFGLPDGFRDARRARLYVRFNF